MKQSVVIRRKNDLMQTMVNHNRDRLITVTRRAQVFLVSKWHCRLHRLAPQSQLVFSATYCSTSKAIPSSIVWSVVLVSKARHCSVRPSKSLHNSHIREAFEEK